MSIRKDWLKGFFRSHTPKNQWKKYDSVDTWSDSTVNEIISEIHSDLKKALRENPVISLSEFDEDFIEYLYEESYEDINTVELSIEFVEWAKEAVDA
jgi:hypothetical protein